MDKHSLDVLRREVRLVCLVIQLSLHCGFQATVELVEFLCQPKLMRAGVNIRLLFENADVLRRRQASSLVTRRARIDRGLLLHLFYLGLMVGNARIIKCKAVVDRTANLFGHFEELFPRSLAELPFV